MGEQTEWINIAVGEPEGHWSPDPPTEPGWYWWRDKNSAAHPIGIGDGPFGNTAFKPGKGWLLAEKIGGEWYSRRIEEPE